jgi:hypothetical protein
VAPLEGQEFWRSVYSGLAPFVIREHKVAHRTRDSFRLRFRTGNEVAATISVSVRA